MSSVTVDFKGVKMELLPEKALFLKELGVLLLADLHLGKATHFRKAGIPIPEDIHNLDFLSLQKILTAYRPQHLYFLGDLFHSSFNTQWNSFLAFLSLFPETHFHLIKGNHDILSPEHYLHPVLSVHDHPIEMDKFLLCHEPRSDFREGILTICGHLHPGVRLKGAAKQSLRIPCFHYTQQTLILPSFGNFTGLALVERKKNDLIYGVTEKRVIPILSGFTIG